MNKLVTRTYPIVTGAGLRKLQSRIRAKRGVFKNFDVWLDVVELDELAQKPGEGHQFWNFFRKWTRQPYYQVTINYQKKEEDNDAN